MTLVQVCGYFHREYSSVVPPVSLSVVLSVAPFDSSPPSKLGEKLSE